MNHKKTKTTYINYMLKYTNKQLSLWGVMYGETKDQRKYYYFNRKDIRIRKS